MFCNKNWQTQKLVLILKNYLNLKCNQSMIFFLLHLSNQDIGTCTITLASNWCPFQCSKTNKYKDLFFFQAEDGIRDVERSRGLGDVYKRQHFFSALYTI